METRDTRLLLLPLVAGSVVFGVALEAAMDPYESAGLAWIGLLAGTLGFAALGGYLYARKRRRLDDPDERFRRIEMRASRLTHGVVTMGLLVVAVALTLPWARDAVWPLAWALLVGSVVVHEAGIEYYRRAM